jgi:glycosyltransferase involved in cell wall biosynthesis
MGSRGRDFIGVGAEAHRDVVDRDIGRVAPMIAPEARRGLGVIVISQAVDCEDPVIPHTVRWIEALARKPSIDWVAVLALRTGRYELPGNVAVDRFGRSNRLGTLAAFYRGVARSLLRRPDFIFIHMGGPYPALLLPVKLFARTPVVEWKTHGVITRATAFYARRCDDLIFTATRASFPMPMGKVRIVGHGIDTQAFSSHAEEPLGDLIAVGRIAPIKCIEEMVRAVDHANRTYGTAYRLDIYGPTLPGDEGYAARVDTLIDRLGARDRIALHGPVLHADLPRLLNAHRAALNFTYRALDKSALEAMACGLPVISTNASVAEIVPSGLEPVLITDAENKEAQAKAIHGVLQQERGETAALGERMRAVVVADHSIDRLFDRILEDVWTLL